MRILTMSANERDRLKSIGQVNARRLTVDEAATTLGLGTRQLYRLPARYRAEGDRGQITRGFNVLREII